jgi:hypothetical protein
VAIPYEQAKEHRVLFVEDPLPVMETLKALRATA